MNHDDALRIRDQYAQIADPFAHREQAFVTIHLRDGDWSMTVGEFIDMVETHRKRLPTGPIA